MDRTQKFCAFAVALAVTALVSQAHGQTAQRSTVAAPKITYSGCVKSVDLPALHFLSLPARVCKYMDTPNGRYSAVVKSELAFGEAGIVFPNLPKIRTDVEVTIEARVLATPSINCFGSLLFVHGAYITRWYPKKGGAKCDAN